MKKISFFSVLMCMSVLFMFSSCSDDGINSVQEDDPITEESAEINDEMKDFLESLDIMIENAEVKPFHFPDGTTEDRVYLDGDITMSQSDFNELQNDPRGEIDARQYRTYNLVNSPRTINVIGYTGGGGYGLTNKMRTALQWSVNNYNAINTGLNFTLTYGTNYQPYDMVVYRVPNGQAGGVAGFPSGGNPYKWVQIFSGMDNYNTNTNEHVITHEMGHCLGMRHTDWFSRQSCGQSGESANPDGAVQIPGTPSGYDSNSVMLACFGSNEDGEFGFYDRVALEYLY